jgi:hypothetical protein
VIGISAAFFFGVILANLIIDPEVVFGTGMLGHSQNENTRYLHVAEYRKEADQVDGLLFGSSRIRSFPLGDLSRRTGDVHYARFSFQSGQMNDYLPVLEYARPRRPRDNDQGGVSAPDADVLAPSR